MPTENHARTAHDIIDGNEHVVLGTADADGRPWVSPVYFAHIGYREFVWVSSPDTRHSRNIGLRRTIAMVIFDSRAPIGTGVGVYMDAR